AARASLSDEAPRSNATRNTLLAATILLAPGGFILGGMLLARALKKRQSNSGSPAKTGISGESAGQALHDTSASAGVSDEKG
ncbi:hypothetical protein, partial [Pseudomonas aeruginosa]|uniref:hypothetical protein n=1 Tax=Pseudomonas aeruginosa TaxID=287 RepID=UPI000B6C24DA